MLDYMYKARSRDAWAAFALSAGVYTQVEDKIMLSPGFQVDEIGIVDPEDEFPYLVNIRVSGEQARLRVASTEDCVWIDPSTVATPLRIWAGGMSYFSPEPLPQPVKGKKK